MRYKVRLSALFTQESDGDISSAIVTYAFDYRINGGAWLNVVTEQIAAGASWVGEYGSMDNPDERAFLESISPYRQVKRCVKYPQPLIWTTTKDDRVGPQHARKFAARLSEL